MEPIFADRRHAGRVLAARMEELRGDSDVVVLGLPRGGVPVAFEVAARLGAPLDVFVVRKLGVPGHEELAMGAIASGGVIVIDRPLIERLGISRGEIEEVIEREQVELGRRELAYRGPERAISVEGRTAILVDDGLATGSSMLAAVKSLRAKRPARIIVGVPVSSRRTCASFESLVEEIVCATMPEPFRAVGLWYRDFAQTDDEEVRALLAQARHGTAASHA